MRGVKALQRRHRFDCPDRAGRVGQRLFRGFSLRFQTIGILAEPTLILWALVRELRGLWQARERERTGSYGGGGWNQSAKPTPRALRRVDKMPLAALLREAALVDRTIKGIVPGDPWSSIVSLTMGMAGALQATRDSGRVAV